jgi:hypothetical protein
MDQDIYKVDNFYQDMEANMAKAKKESKSFVQSKKTGPVIYIGPNLPGGTLSAFTVYKNGLPVHIKDLQEKTPELKALFVPVSDLATARRRLNRPGPEANAVQAVRKKFNM